MGQEKDPSNFAWVPRMGAGSIKKELADKYVDLGSQKLGRGLLKEKRWEAKSRAAKNTKKETPFKEI